MSKGFYIQEGNNINYINSGSDDIQYLDVLVLEERVGIALCDIPTNALGAVALGGVFELPAASGDTANVGAKVYWNAAAGEATTTSGAVACGFVVEPKASGTTTVRVKIN